MMKRIKQENGEGWRKEGLMDEERKEMAWQKMNESQMGSKGVKKKK